jgi:hypothetical protein
MINKELVLKIPECVEFGKVNKLDAVYYDI